MNKPNNIQDRIKLLMEYDTSKTYSENKELINEATMPAWLIRAVDYILNVYKVKRGPEALNQIKNKFITNFNKKYANPKNIVNLLKGEDKRKYVDILKEIEILEPKVIKSKTNKPNPVDIDNLLEYRKQLYIIYFTQIQKEFKKYANVADLFDDTDLNNLINSINGERVIKDLDDLFITERHRINNLYNNIQPTVFWHYVFEFTTKGLTTAYWTNQAISLLRHDINIGANPYTKEETIKTICGDTAKTCTPTMFNKMSEVLTKSANSKAKLFILSAIIYGLFKNRNNSQFYKNITKCDFCKLSEKYPLKNLELNRDEDKYKNYIEAMLKYYKSQNKDAYNIIKYGFNYNKDGFTIDTNAFNRNKFTTNLNSVFKAYESTYNNKKIIIENDNLLLNENISKIANFLWGWFKKGINPLNYVKWVLENKGLTALILLIVKITIIDTNMARWLLRSLLRLPTSNIMLTVRIRAICETNLCLNNTPAKKEMDDFAKLINNGGEFEKTVYGLVLADYSKQNTKYFTKSDICKLNQLTKNRFSTNFDIFVKQYGGRSADSLKSLFDYNYDVLTRANTFGVNVPESPSGNNPLSYIDFAYRKVISFKDTAVLMGKNVLGFTLIDKESFIKKWENNCLGASDSTTPNNSNNTNNPDDEESLI